MQPEIIISPENHLPLGVHEQDFRVVGANVQYGHIMVRGIQSE